MKAQSQGEQKSEIYFGEPVLSDWGCYKLYPKEFYPNAKLVPMKENKGEQPEQESPQKLKEIIESESISAVENAFSKGKFTYPESYCELYERGAYFGVALVTAKRLAAAQPSKVQEKELIYKQEQLLEKQELEIERLKLLLSGQCYSIWKGCGSDLSFEVWKEKFISGNNL